MSFFDELKRREVYRVAILYAVVGFGVIEGAGLIQDPAAPVAPATPVAEEEDDLPRTLSRARLSLVLRNFGAVEEARQMGRFR